MMLIQLPIAKRRYRRRPQARKRRRICERRCPSDAIIRRQAARLLLLPQRAVPRAGQLGQEDWESRLVWQA